MKFTFPSGFLEIKVLLKWVKWKRILSTPTWQFVRQFVRIPLPLVSRNRCVKSHDDSFIIVIIKTKVKGHAQETVTSFLTPERKRQENSLSFFLLPCFFLPCSLEHKSNSCLALDNPSLILLFLFLLTIHEQHKTSTRRRGGKVLNFHHSMQDIIWKGRHISTGKEDTSLLKRKTHLGFYVCLNKWIEFQPECHVNR